MKKRIASAMLALCLVLPFLPVNVQAADIVADGTCGTNVNWTLDSDGLLTISGTGSMTSWTLNPKSRPWYDYTDEITSVVVNEGVITIGDRAFEGCENLSSVTIPSSVIYIGTTSGFRYSPFHVCGGLTSIEVASENERYCSEDGVLFDKNKTVLIQYPVGRNVTSYSIPDSVYHVEHGAFRDCTSLTSITIPNSVTNIGEAAFTACSGLTSITIPDSVTYISDYAFGACHGLTSVTIPGGVTHIGYRAFSMCHGLTSITILDGVKEINNHAFVNCMSLTSVTIPKSVTLISIEAFSGCDSLKDVYYGGSKEEWNKIRISDGNDDMKNANIHYDFQMPPSTSFTVTFDSQGGTAVDRQVVATGSKVKLPSAPTRTSHTFGGWYKEQVCMTPWNFDADTVTNDMTLYAKWIADTPAVKSYTITFESNGGTAVPSQIVAEGDLVEHPTETMLKDGYKFEGWYKDQDLKIEWDFLNDKVNQDIMLYAKWKQTSFVITFDANGGTIATTMTENQTTIKSHTSVDGTLGSFPGAKWDSHQFSGWYTEAMGGTKIEYSPTYKFTEDTTLYAHWDSLDNSTTDPVDPGKPDSTKTYTVTFDPNGGTVSPTMAATDTNGKVTLPTPTRMGYSFDGWFTTASGGEKVLSDKTFQENTTIYAHWTQDTASVKTRYKIYTPGSISGGSYDVSHSSAVQGARITVEVSPRRNYELEWLAVTNLTTGQELHLTQRGSDEYTFVMPASSVELDISYDGSRYIVYEEPQLKTGPNAWYYRDRHIYHVENGLVPDGTHITRDMLISVLYNMTSPAVISRSIGCETNDSQVWATDNGIVPDIYASGLWGFDKILSREQAAMLIFRYAGYRGCGTAQRQTITRYSDYSRLRPDARAAMSWAVATGLMPGASASTLAPRDSITCGQMGELLFKFEATILR